MLREINRKGKAKTEEEELDDLLEASKGDERDSVASWEEALNLN